MLLYPAYSCGLCVPCRRGQDMYCERHQFTGLTRDGGFADYVLVDERSLLRLPEGIEPAEVAPHADADHRLPRGEEAVPRLEPGSTVAVIGVGGVGHIGLQLVQVLGAARVIASTRTSAAGISRASSAPTTSSARRTDVAGAAAS